MLDLFGVVEIPPQALIAAAVLIALLLAIWLFRKIKWLLVLAVIATIVLGLYWARSRGLIDW